MLLPTFVCGWICNNKVLTTRRHVRRCPQFVNSPEHGFRTRGEWQVRRAALQRAESLFKVRKGPSKHAHHRFAGKHAAIDPSSATSPECRMVRHARMAVKRRKRTLQSYANLSCFFLVIRLTPQHGDEEQSSNQARDDANGHIFRGHDGAGGDVGPE